MGGEGKPPSTPTRHCSIFCSQGAWSCMFNLPSPLPLSSPLHPPLPLLFFTLPSPCLPPPFTFSSFLLPSPCSSLLSLSLPSFLSTLLHSSLSSPLLSLIHSPLSSLPNDPLPSQMHSHTVLANVLLMISLGGQLATLQTSTLRTMRMTIRLLITLHRVDSVRVVSLLDGGDDKVIAAYKKYRQLK